MTQTHTVRVPGKLILSGEHAVVYGQAALALSHSSFTTARARLCAGDEYHLDLQDLKFAGRFSRAQLHAHYQTLHRRYQAPQPMPVCRAPSDLIVFTLASYLERYPELPPCALTLSSDIPLGRGMGSSSAAILAVLAVLDSLQDLSTHDLRAFARDIEHLQHGLSSGLDLACAEAGGIIFFEDTHIEPLTVELFPAWLIDTGPSDCATGECVKQAQQVLSAGTCLQQFGLISHRLKAALIEQSLACFKQSIADNHQLLCRLGVVPVGVRDFVAEIEAAGGVAKISGAGSIRGLGAGFMLAFDLDEALLEASPYPYRALTVSQQGLQHV